MNQHQRPFWTVTAELFQEPQTTPQGLTDDEAEERLKRIVIFYIVAAEMAKRAFYKKSKF